MTKATIEGLKVTVPGLELLGMLRDEMERHLVQVELYRLEIRTDTTHEDTAFKAMRHHQAEAAELDFLQQWLNTSTNYVLGSADLRKLGKIAAGW